MAAELHQDAMQEYRHYCITGGMPAVIKADIARDAVLTQEESRHIAFGSPEGILE